ncbi:hypothetical protein FOL47_001044, partial [Perkinsus chesapeaki]
MYKKNLWSIKCTEKLESCLKRWLDIMDEKFERSIDAVENGRHDPGKCLVLADASTRAIGSIILEKDKGGCYCRLKMEDLLELEDFHVHNSGPSCANMVTYELAAVSMGVIEARRRGYSGDEIWVLSDSLSGVSLMRKGFSSKIGPANVVAAITRLITEGVHISDRTLYIHHIDGEQNEMADRISREL